MRLELLNRIVGEPDSLDSLSPREFEELVATVLESFGWQVSLTQQTRDGGYDMFAIQTEVPGLEVSWIVECKKYSQERPVPVNVVRSLYGVRDYLSIANAAIITTARFTQEALTFAKNRTAIKLIDRSMLLKWISKAAKAIPPETPPKRFDSLFISYSTKDEEFAKQLHARMRDAGMRVWFAPEDLKAGDYFLEQIERAIRMHDRLLLVLSEDSIKSKWVEREFRKARKMERAEKRKKLFPITLIDYGELKKWECLDSDTGEDLAEEVRKYHIPDFSNWKNHDAFERAFARLEKDLRTSIGG